MNSQQRNKDVIEDYLEIKSVSLKVPYEDQKGKEIRNFKKYYERRSHLVTFELILFA